jgi:hypothetical protein
MAVPIQARSLTVDQAKGRLLEPEHGGVEPILSLIHRHPGITLLLAAAAGIAIARSPKARSLAAAAVVAAVRQSLK